MNLSDIRVTSQRLQYELLKSFWHEFGKNGNKHFVSSKSKQTTLECLRDVGNCVVIKKNNPSKNSKDRLAFNKIKSARHSLASHRSCFACKNKADVRHHIIWLKHGGLNSKKNLVSLCHSCHSFIHPWLMFTKGE